MRYQQKDRPVCALYSLKSLNYPYFVVVGINIIILYTTLTSPQITLATAVGFSRGFRGVSYFSPDLCFSAFRLTKQQRFFWVHLLCAFFFDSCSYAICKELSTAPRRQYNSRLWSWMNITSQQQRAHNNILTSAGFGIPSVWASVTKQQNHLLRDNLYIIIIWYYY